MSEETNKVTSTTFETPMLRIRDLKEPTLVDGQLPAGKKYRGYAVLTDKIREDQHIPTGKAIMAFLSVGELTTLVRAGLGGMGAITNATVTVTHTPAALVWEAQVAYYKELKNKTEAEKMELISKLGKREEFTHDKWTLNLDFFEGIKNPGGITDDSWSLLAGLPGLREEVTDCLRKEAEIKRLQSGQGVDLMSALGGGSK